MSCKLFTRLISFLIPQFLLEVKQSLIFVKKVWISQFLSHCLAL